MIGDKKDKFILFFRTFYLAAFFILCLSLLYYQIIKGDYYLMRARNNYVRIIPEQSLRGTIFDRNGVALAYDKASFNIAVIPYQIRDHKQAILASLAAFSGYSVKQLNRNYNRNFQNLFSPTDVILDIDKPTAFKLKEKFKDDVLIDPQPQRFYPKAFEYSHLLGYVQQAAAFYDDLKRYGYAPNERIGLSGIEEYYDNYLRGQGGGDLIEVNSRGRIVGFLGNRATEKGQDIYLTVDSTMQEAAYKALEGRRGAVILMDSKNGEILCLASSPAYNPNNFVRGKDVEGFLTDKSNPLQNRAVQSTYPLGSTFKPVVAMAALEEKKITPFTTFSCNGKFNLGKAEFNCEKSHGSQDLYQGITHSCNIYFYNTGLKLGAPTLLKWGSRYGLDSATQIDLPSERKGNLVSLNRSRPWYAGDTLNLSIGQGDLRCSPVEILTAINAFATSGYLVKPHLIKKIGDTEILAAEKKNLNVSQYSLTIIKAALRMVVESEEGTGRLLKPLNLRIAGKTGTAQAKGGAHGWFIGYFPYEEPKFAICVFLENAGSSYEALKIVYSFLENLKLRKLI
jgi:penicillin-binding protein 2